MSLIRGNQVFVHNFTLLKKNPSTHLYTQKLKLSALWPREMWGNCVSFSQEVTPLGGAPSVSRGFCFVSLFFCQSARFLMKAGWCLQAKSDLLTQRIMFGLIAPV